MLFPSTKFPFLVDPKQISVILKVKNSLSSFCNFSPFHLKFLPNSLFQFSFFFFPLFLFFLPYLFSDRLAEISRSEVSWGHSNPCLLRHCCPPLLMCMLTPLTHTPSNPSTPGCRQVQIENRMFIIMNLGNFQYGRPTKCSTVLAKSLGKRHRRTFRQSCAIDPSPESPGIQHSRTRNLSLKLPNALAFNKDRSTVLQHLHHLNSVTKV